MQSAKSGNVIRKIRIGKKDVSIVFDKETIKISPDAYTEFRLYVGKTITEEELSSIKKRNEIDKFLKDSLLMVTRGHPTTRALHDKLTAKGANAIQIEEIITILTKGGFVDDQQFVDDYLEYAFAKGYGQERIKGVLYEKGVPHKLIESIVFDYDEELERASKMLPRLEEKFTRYNHLQKKRRIHDAYMRLGYHQDIILKVITKMSQNTVSQEQDHLRVDYQKAVRKYGEGNRHKIIDYLRGKGYSYRNISQVMAEEQNNEMD
ncbi:MAG: hypothetical protein EOM77_02625 [Bacteroidia bacterium]|nr:hypothetical protein [Bacteroidia bacterium]